MHASYMRAGRKIKRSRVGTVESWVHMLSDLRAQRREVMTYSGFGVRCSGRWALGTYLFRRDGQRKEKGEGKEGGIQTLVLGLPAPLLASFRKTPHNPAGHQ